MKLSLFLLSILASTAGSAAAARGPGAAVSKFNNKQQATTKKAVADVKGVVRGGADKDISLPLSQAVTAGVLLAFNSGFMNGACLAGAIVPGTKQAVAAVTGAWTTSAVGWASGDTKAMTKQLAMILSYAGGSAIAALLDPYPTPFKLNAKAVGPGFLLCSLLTYLASTKASAGETTLIIFSLAAIANGLQNSITSVASGNLIRTAHYSGMTSDMGTFLGQYLRGNKANFYKLKTNLALALAFWGGGALSFFATEKYASSTLMFSAIAYALFGLFVEYLQLK